MQVALQKNDKVIIPGPANVMDRSWNLHYPSFTLHVFCVVLCPFAVNVSRTTSSMGTQLQCNRLRSFLVAGGPDHSIKEEEMDQPAAGQSSFERCVGCQPNQVPVVKSIVNQLWTAEYALNHDSCYNSRNFPSWKEFPALHVQTNPLHINVQLVMIRLEVECCTVL